MLNRQVTTDWTLPNTNVTIEKGTEIVIPAMNLQRDPKYWPEPDAFVPERFSPEQSGDATFLDRPYLPFGIGPRHCVGMRLGKMQTKLALLTLLRKYDYELTSAAPMELNVSSYLLKPEGGINVKVSHRKTK